MPKPTIDRSKRRVHPEQVVPGVKINPISNSELSLQALNSAAEQARINETVSHRLGSASNDLVNLPEEME